MEGLRREAREEKDIKCICMERSSGSFGRIVSIPVPVKTVEGRASYVDGVLTLTLPKL